MNVRCFCCDACAKVWRWHYAKRWSVAFIVAGCVSAAAGLLVYFVPDIPRESPLRSAWVWLPLAICLIAPIIGAWAWWSARNNLQIHPDSKAKLETLLGEQFLHLRVRDRPPTGERVVNCG